MSAAMDSVKGLNEYHLTQMDNILRYLRQKRTRQVKDVESVFDDVKEDRLLEENYNNDDVISILEHATNMVTASMETELAHVAYTQALVVRQLLTQAEVHGSQLSIDEGELENQKAINDMKLYDDEKSKNPSLKPALVSIGKQAKPLLVQLNDLQDENKTLKKQMESLNSQLAMAQEAASRAAGGSGGPPPLPPTGGPPPLPGLPGAGLAPPFPGAGGPAPLLAPVAPMMPAAAPMAPAGNATADNGQLEKLKADLAAKSKELQDTKKELTAKVGQTTQYQNLRKMMGKKTEELKKYKTEIQKYDSNFGKDDSGSEVEDDDSD